MIPCRLQLVTIIGTRQRDAAGACKLFNTVGADHVDEGGNLVDGTGRFDDECFGAHVDDFCAEDVDDFLKLGAFLFVGVELYHDEFALDVAVFGEVGHFNDFDDKHRKR